MFSAIADGFGFLFDLLGQIAHYILMGLSALIKPVLDFLGGIFYFIYMLGVVIAKVVLLVFGVAKVLVGLVTGLFKTITGFSYSGASAAMPSMYQSAFAKLQPLFQTLQLGKVAYLFMFATWIFTAMTAMKIIGNMRKGGD